MAAPVIDALRDGVTALLALPRGDQPAAVRALRSALPAPADEPWNTAFGPDSLYAAFARSSVARGAHAANRAVLGPILDRPFVVVDVGGGSGAVWDGLLRPDHVGEIVVVDPHPDGAAGVRRHAPRGVTVRHLHTPVEAAVLPDADAIVASLVLHHVAGGDAADRARVGLSGPGKREVLASFRDAVRTRGGTVIVNEADVYCDLGLAPGDPLLAERLVDSYVRRFAVSLLHDLATRDEPDDVRVRWAAIVRDWALGQIAVADAAWADRDVYERDVVSWLALFAEAGLAVRSRQATDRWMLFHQYVLDGG
ncbi:MAG: methyltransferase domain-containing protein [Myxococcota bacterium]